MRRLSDAYRMCAVTSNFDPSKEIRLLLAFFGESRLPQCLEIDVEEVPQRERDLLAHRRHMTVTLEEHYRDRVKVVPYRVHQQGDLYGRKLDLVADSSGLVVMTGIMLFNFSCCDSKVRDLILAEEVPLGRILIENRILRRISSETFVRVEARDPFVQRFDLKTPQPAFGRLATIFYNGEPAVDLLEVVRPEDRPE